MRRFWRGLMIFMLGGVLGTGFGVALGFFPFSVRVSAAAGRRAVERGRPRGAGRDRRLHPRQPVRSGPLGEGQGRRLSERGVPGADFEVGPGPKYHVYLVPNAKVRDEAQVKGTMFVDLGRLRAFKGSQRYAIPAGVDLKKYPSVVIWCEQFGVLISPADLTFQSR